MKKSHTLVGNTTIFFLRKANLLNTIEEFERVRREVLLNMKRHFIKELHILVGNAVNNFLRREVLLNTNEQYMKQSNSLVGNATIKQLYIGKPY